MENNENRPIGEDFEQNGVENTENNSENGFEENPSETKEENQTAVGTEDKNGGNYFGNDFSNRTGNGYQQGQGGFNGFTPGFEGYSYNGNEPVMKDENEKKGFGIAAMVLGIVSLVCCCFGGYAIVCSILAIIFAVLRMKVKSDGFAIAGLVLGIIGVLFNGAMLALAYSGVLEEIAYELEQYESVLGLIGSLL